MHSIFTEEQLNHMSRENLVELIKIMKNESSKKEQKISEKEQEIRLLKEREKELLFLNALLSDRLTLAQKKQFGSSSEKYAEGYEQMHLFNEAEKEVDPNAEEPAFEEIHPSSYKRKNVAAKKRKISVLLKLRKQWNINWKEKHVTVLTVAKNIKL